MKTFTLILAALLACVPASAQTTQPFPVAVFHQPVRNFDLLKDANVTVLFGPEVENSGAMTPAQLLAKDLEWLAKADAMGFKVVLKRAWTLPKVPANCIGFAMEKDEPNGKGLAAADLKANFDQLRALDPEQADLPQSRRRQNLIRQLRPRLGEAGLHRLRHRLRRLHGQLLLSEPQRQPLPDDDDGDIVKKLATATKKPVWFWCEMNDQVVLPLAQAHRRCLTRPNRQRNPDDVGVCGKAGGRGRRLVRHKPIREIRLAGELLAHSGPRREVDRAAARDGQVDRRSVRLRQHDAPADHSPIDPHRRHRPPGRPGRPYRRPDRPPRRDARGERAGDATDQVTGDRT
jgi:hypothetical protein